MTKFIVIVAAATLSTAAFAQDDCRSLSTVEKRNECHVRKTMSELPPASKVPPVMIPATPAVPDQVDELSQENERVSGKLRGICRGC
jgi:hypothetical protein